MTLALILVDRVAGVAYDISGFAQLKPIAEQIETTGRAATCDFPLWSSVNGTPIPVMPRPGLEVAFGDPAAFPGNPDPWDYYFTGAVRALNPITDRVDGLALTLKCSDFTAELNTALPPFVFNGVDHPTDQARIAALFAAARMPATWDASSLVEGPYITYGAPTETPYQGKVADILAQIAGDTGGAPAVSTTLGTDVPAPGVMTVTPPLMAGITVGRVLTIGGTTAEQVTVTAVTQTTFTATFAHPHTLSDSVTAALIASVNPRKYFTSASWTNPANYAAGLTRYVSYFSDSDLPADPVPLTDDPTGQADYVSDVWDRGNNTSSQGRADTGQGWSGLQGTWGINNGYAYQVSSSADNVAIVESTISDALVEVALHVIATDVGLALRVSTDTGGALWKGWLFIAQPTSNRYGLYKRQAGNYGLIGTIAVAPANNDVIRVQATGASLTASVYRSGVLQGSFSTTDSFQQTATWHGLVAVSAQPTARWGLFRVNGAATQYLTGWTDVEDGIGLANTVLISGPPVAPAPVGWDTVVQPPVNVLVAAGGLTKTGGTDGSYDAGGTTQQQFDGAGGEITWSTNSRLIGQDTFTRPDADYLGGLESGQDWQRSNAAYRWGVRSNTAAPVAVGASGMGVAWVDSGCANAIVQCTFSASVASASRLVVRLTDENNLLFVSPASGHYELYKRVAGSLTLLGSGGSTPANGDVIKISLEGSTINVYAPGSSSPVISVVETFNQHATRHGIGTTSAGAACRWDDFSVRQLYVDLTLGLRHGASAGTRQQPAFGIVFKTDRTAQVTEGGTLRGSPRTYAAGDFWKITATFYVLPTPRYEIAYYYRPLNATHWTLFYGSATYPDLVLSWQTDVALASLGAAITDLTWQPYTDNLFVDSVSVSTYGVQPAPDTVQDTSLDTWNKRAAHAQSYFTQHVLRKTYTITSPRRYKGGMVVLWTALRLGILNARKTVVTAKVDRSNGSRTQPMYVLTLDAPPRLAGVRDPFAYLSSGPDGVRTPGQPTGLAQGGAGVPNSDNTKSVVPIVWDAPGINAEWIELWAQPVAGAGDVQARWPAAGQRGTLDLAFLRPYHVQARFIPYAGQAGPWCAPVDAVGGEPGLPNPPTGLFQARGGWNSKGAWVVVGFTPPGGTFSQYEARWWLDGTLPSRMPFDANAEETPPLAVLPNLTYHVEIRCQNSAGPGPWSAPCTVRVITIGPQPPPPTTIAPDGTVDGWADPADGTVALASDVTYRSGASFALAPAVGNTTTLPSLGLQTVTPGAWVHYGIAAALLDGSTDTAAELDLIWGDAIGTPLATTAIPLTPLPAGVTLADDSGDVLTDDDGDVLTTLPALGVWEDQVQVPTSIDGLKTLLTAVLVTASLIVAGTVYADVYTPPRPALTAPAYTPGSVGAGAVADGAISSAKIAAGAVGDAQMGVLTQLQIKAGPGGGYEILDALGNVRGRLYYDSSGLLRLAPVLTGGVHVGGELNSTWGDTLFVGDPASGGGITITPASGKVVTINNGVYSSSDGSAGSTEDITIAGVVYHYKNGLLVGHTP